MGFWGQVVKGKTKYVSDVETVLNLVGYDDRELEKIASMLEQSLLFYGSDYLSLKGKSGEWHIYKIPCIKDDESIYLFEDSNGMRVQVYKKENKVLFGIFSPPEMTVTLGFECKLYDK